MIMNKLHTITNMQLFIFNLNNVGVNKEYYKIILTKKKRRESLCHDSFCFFLMDEQKILDMHTHVVISNKNKFENLLFFSSIAMTILNDNDDNRR